MGKWRRNLSLPRRWQRNHLISKYGTDCYLCGEPIESIKQITFDHWQPLSRGGSDNLTNYRLAHLNCNQLKGALEPNDFMAFQIGQIKWED